MTADPELLAELVEAVAAGARPSPVRPSGGRMTRITDADPVVFDGPALAHGWLAVASAAAVARDAAPALRKTVLIEQHQIGLRLYALDGFVLLVTWVPFLEFDVGLPTEPDLDEAPDRVVIACDDDGLGRHLLGHVLSLASRIKEEDYQAGMVSVAVEFDVELPADPSKDEAFEGLTPKYVVLTVPDVEKVYLPVVDAPAPDWRGVVHGFEAEETKQVALNAEFVERLGKVRRHAAGSLLWRFGGAGRTALVDWPDSDPHVFGAVVPRKPADDGSGADAEVCEQCVDPDRVCLRHQSGVVTLDELDGGKA